MDEKSKQIEIKKVPTRKLLASVKLDIRTMASEGESMSDVENLSAEQQEWIETLRRETSRCPMEKCFAASLAELAADRAEIARLQILQSDSHDVLVSMKSERDALKEVLKAVVAERDANWKALQKARAEIATL